MHRIGRVVSNKVGGSKLVALSYSRCGTASDGLASYYNYQAALFNDGLAEFCSELSSCQSPQDTHGTVSMPSMQDAVNTEELSCFHHDWDCLEMAEIDHSRRSQ